MADKKPLSRLQKLDRVLSILNHKRDYRDTIDSVSHDTELGLNEDEILSFIDKFQSDGFVYVFSQGRITASNFQNGLEVKMNAHGEDWLQQGGYVKAKRRKWWDEFPKRNWPWVALFTFLLGFFGDLIKEQLTQKKLQPSTQQVQVFLTCADTVQSHKTHPVYLDSVALNTLIDTTKWIKKQVVKNIDTSKN